MRRSPRSFAVTAAALLVGATATFARQPYARVVGGPGVPNASAFSASAAIDSGVVALGAPIDDVNGRSSGSVRLFDAVTGAELDTVSAADGDAGDLFGWSVDLRGGTLAVGADGDEGPETLAGSAYRFDLANLAGSTRLTASDGRQLAIFGYDVAVDPAAGLTLVSAPGGGPVGQGAVYVFDTQTGQEQRQLLPDAGGQTDRAFGNAIAIGDGIAAIGSPRESPSVANGPGPSVYLFDPQTGSRIDRLTPPNDDVAAEFGTSVDLDDGVLIVGAPFARVPELNNAPAGSAWLYDTASGRYFATLTPDEAPQGFGISSPLFGQSVAISGGMALVGAPLLPGDRFREGAAYLFDVATGQRLDRLAPNAASDNYFGFAVAMDGGVAVVAAKQPGAETAYLYDATYTNPLEGDYNLDGVVDAADYTVWRDAQGRPSVVINADGDQRVDAEDYTAWAAGFGAALPPLATVPEPVAAVLLALGCGLLARRSRR
ncbi:MAG: hypothetical protein AAF805_09130 [Planctomycetota bacterium]